MVWWWINISNRIKREKRAWTESMIQMTSIKSHNFIHFFVVVSFISTLWYHWTVICTHRKRERESHAHIVKKSAGEFIGGAAIVSILFHDLIVVAPSSAFFLRCRLYMIFSVYFVTYRRCCLAVSHSMEMKICFVFFLWGGNRIWNFHHKCNKLFNGWRTRFRESECSIQTTTSTAVLVNKCLDYYVRTGMSIRIM